MKPGTLRALARVVGEQVCAHPGMTGFRMIAQQRYAVHTANDAIELRLVFSWVARLVRSASWWASAGCFGRKGLWRVAQRIRRV